MENSNGDYQLESGRGGGGPKLVKGLSTLRYTHHRHSLVSFIPHPCPP